jgi:dTDP-glucose 4,6-dehydratase
LDLILEGKADTLIQISTDEVYGSILKGSWTEDYNLQPNSPYSASKASADLLAMSYYSSFDLDVRITRASNNFGPRQHSEKMIPTIINSILRNNPIPVYGTGNQIRDWLHVQDHVQGIWQAIKHGKKGQVYNLGGGTELTNLDLIAEISKFFPERKILIEHVEDRKGHDFRYSLDFTKANQELGYSPGVTLQDGLAKTIEFYINASSIET